MSRVGKKPVSWASGTKVSVSGNVVKVEAGKVSLQQQVDPCIRVEVDEGARLATFTRTDDSKRARAMHGLYRSLVANMVKGTQSGFEKKLSIIGVGFNAKLEGKSLVLNVGFNAPVKWPIPAGLSIEVPQPTSITVKGADKQAVGQFAAEIRALRKPEPYKGKGIRYENEFVRRKVGKSLGA